MTQDYRHPATPPPELVQQWLAQRADYEKGFNELLIEAAQWGADQELETCCEWLDREGWSGESRQLRAARRPKPPSLKEQALNEFDSLVGDSEAAGAAVILRALEALPDD